MSKYLNIAVEYKGFQFQSKGEQRRYKDLCLLETAGEIDSLRVHPRFLIIPKNGKERATYYEADFAYFEKGKPGVLVIEDVKAWDKKKSKFRTTEAFNIKRKLLLYVSKGWEYQIEFRLVAA